MSSLPGNKGRISLPPEKKYILKPISFHPNVRVFSTNAKINTKIAFCHNLYKNQIKIELSTSIPSHINLKKFVTSMLCGIFLYSIFSHNILAEMTKVRAIHRPSVVRLKFDKAWLDTDCMGIWLYRKGAETNTQLRSGKVFAKYRKNSIETSETSGNRPLLVIACGFTVF